MQSRLCERLPGTNLLTGLIPGSVHLAKGTNGIIVTAYLEQEKFLLLIQEQQNGKGAPGTSKSGDCTTNSIRTFLRTADRTRENEEWPSGLGNTTQLWLKEVLAQRPVTPAWQSVFAPVGYRRPGDSLL